MEEDRRQNREVIDRLKVYSKEECFITAALLRLRRSARQTRSRETKAEEGKQWGDLKRTSWRGLANDDGNELFLSQYHLFHNPFI